MNGETLLNANQIVVVESTGNSAAPEKASMRMNIDPRLGTFQMDCVFNRYFTFHEVKASFNYKTLLESDGDYSKQQFGLALVWSGKDTATFGGRPVEVAAGGGAFTYHTGVPEVHRFCAERPLHVEYFEMDADYFTNLLFDYTSENEGMLADLKQSVARREFANCVTPATALHRRIISDVKNCPLQGSLGNLMLEESLQQLIALQLSYLASAPEKQTRISARDKEILHAVKDHLHNTFHEDHSLLELSKHFGINQCKLKKHFRELFGMPVIEYVFNLKMEHARTLLYDKGLYVAEVAPAVGYRNPNHFATAFKRKFGVNPSKLKM